MLRTSLIGLLMIAAAAIQAQSSDAEFEESAEISVLGSRGTRSVYESVWQTVVAAVRPAAPTNVQSNRFAASLVQRSEVNYALLRAPELDDARTA